MSIVNNVLEELKIDVKSDINAANITEIMIPRSPSGITPRTKRGKAILEQLARFWQIAMHYKQWNIIKLWWNLQTSILLFWWGIKCIDYVLTVSGLTHPTSLGYKTRLIIPGITIKNKGRTFIQPVRIVAPCACVRDFADNAFWTII